MDFRFDKDEADVIEQAGLTLRRHLPATRLLAPGGALAGWRAVGADGWLHAGLAEGQGGVELPLAMLAAIGREAGRVLAGDGFVNNAVVLAQALASADAADTLLEHPGFLLADGRTETLLAPPEQTVDWCFGVEPGMAAYRLGQDGTLERFVPDAWKLAPMGRLGLGVGRVTLAEDAEADATFATGGRHARLLAAADVVHAAGLVGLGEQALRDTVEYTSQREQFGAPIGRFQAVKHALADVAVELEVAWNAVLYAALRPDDTSVSIAHVQAVSAGEAASRAMVQYFGGIAMTWEHHAHLYLKTAQASRWRFGSTQAHALRIADELLLQEVAS